MNLRDNKIDNISSWRIYRSFVCNYRIIGRSIPIIGTAAMISHPRAESIIKKKAVTRFREKKQLQKQPKITANLLSSLNELKLDSKRDIPPFLSGEKSIIKGRGDEKREGRRRAEFPFRRKKFERANFFLSLPRQRERPLRR